MKRMEQELVLGVLEGMGQEPKVVPDLDQQVMVAVGPEGMDQEDNGVPDLEPQVMVAVASEDMGQEHKVVEDLGVMVQEVMVQQVMEVTLVILGLASKCPVLDRDKFVLDLEPVADPGKHSNSPTNLHAGGHQQV
jgi:hypothetical protein